MKTLSNERLEQYAFDKRMCNVNDEIIGMARELLALRKEREAAVPVAWKWRLTSIHGGAQIGPWQVCLTPLSPGINPNYSTEAIPLYAAPPAQPVAVPVRYMNRYTGACYTLEQQPDAATDTAVYVPLYDVAQPVAVPDEVLAAMEEVLRISARDHEAWHRARDGIESCRAAMLQSFGNSEQLNSPVIPDGWVAVPVKPTKEMLGQIHPITEADCPDCGKRVTADCGDNVLMSWEDMLAAVPKQESE